MGLLVFTGHVLPQLNYTLGYELRGYGYGWHTCNGLQQDVNLTFK